MWKEVNKIKEKFKATPDPSLKIIDTTESNSREVGQVFEKLFSDTSTSMANGAIRWSCCPLAI